MMTETDPTTPNWQQTILRQVKLHFNEPVRWRAPEGELTLSILMRGEVTRDGFTPHRECDPLSYEQLRILADAHVKLRAHSLRQAEAAE